MKSTIDPDTANFMNNAGGILWFTGVIEDIQDPEEMGRVRVRCFGFHTDSKLDIPIEDLPWATVMLPVTSASMSSIGLSATGLLQGSWVVGFFRDGANAQDPLVVGSIASKSFEVNYEKGFTDEDEQYPRERLLEKPDIPTPAQSKDEVYKESQCYKSIDGLRQEEIEVAVKPGTKTIDDSEDAERSTWSNHVTDEIYKPKYPYNHVKETVSGHVIEEDDTEGFERLSKLHRSGTHEQILANGDKTVTVVGDDYEVVLNNKNVYIKGTVNLTVDGNCNTLVKGDHILEVEGNKYEYVKGNSVEKVGGNKIKEVDGKDEENIGADKNSIINANENKGVVGNKSADVGGNHNLNVKGNDSNTSEGNKMIAVAGDSGEAVQGKKIIASTDNMVIETAADLKTDATGNTEIVSSGNMSATASRIDLN